MIMNLVSVARRPPRADLRRAPNSGLESQAPCRCVSTSLGEPCRQKSPMPTQSSQNVTRTVRFECEEAKARLSIDQNRLAHHAIVSMLMKLLIPSTTTTPRLRHQLARQSSGHPRYANGNGHVLRHRASDRGREPKTSEWAPSPSSPSSCCEPSWEEGRPSPREG